jgi:hypothetical protein
VNCQLVFDVRDAGPGILVLPGVFGLLLVVIGIPIHLAMRKKWPYKSWGTLVAGIIFLAIGGANLAGYVSLCHALDAGTLPNVEGIVRNFVPAPERSPTSVDVERFDVAGRHFQYSERDMTAGFHQIQRHGSPLADGVYVRIRHFEGTIARLEVCGFRPSQ